MSVAQSRSAILGTKGHANARARALADVIKRIRNDGITSYRLIAETLNTEHVPTPRGGRWSKTSVARLVTRLQELRIIF